MSLVSGALFTRDVPCWILGDAPHWNDRIVMTDLEKLQNRPLPFAKLLGIRFTAASRERVVAELCTRPDVLHGGALMAFADTLGAAATVLNLPEGAGTTTIESKTNFLAAAPVGTTVTGECLPLHRGRRTMVWQTIIRSADVRAVGVVIQTQLVLEPRTAG
jgi:1,4-dihydroxy-2-naphthoyl-CoA hydrolase